MTYSNLEWDDFHTEGLGPSLPLSQEARQQLPSGLLPSGEANGYDFQQTENGPINKFYPNPYGNIPSGEFSLEWWESSGILNTYPEESGTLSDPERESGILFFNELFSRFSNSTDINEDQITDFTIFNPYVHHKAVNNKVIKIPYISTYDVHIDFNPYGGWKGFGE